MTTTTHIRRRALALAPLVLAVLLLPAGPAVAAGTAAGTDITNFATVDYTMGGSNYTVTSTMTVVRVAELLDHSIVWQDAGPVTVSPGQTDRAVIVELTNTGNGTDSYSLTATSILGGDTFDPTLVNVYLDVNGNNVYDAGTDTVYVPGGNDPVLVPDASVTIFILNDIPAAGVSDGDTGDTRLTTNSLTGTGAPGTTLPGLGEGGTDAVIGGTGGSASATATYIVTSTMVVLTKSALVTDPWGGSQPVTGATAQYTITATISGSGTAAGIIVTDPIPGDTTYRAGTLILNGAALSDGADADAGDVGATSPGTVTVNLGDLTSASPVQTITFEVTIN